MADPLARLRLPLRIRLCGDEGIKIEDAAGLSCGFVYYDDGCAGRRAVRNRLTREEAEEVAKVYARALTERIGAARVPGCATSTA